LVEEKDLIAVEIQKLYDEARSEADMHKMAVESLH